MARTQKWTVHEGASEPRYFTHNGHIDTNPNKVSKEGNGKFNWGKPGDELEDEELGDINFFKKSPRRNSNHSQNEAQIQRAIEDKDAT